MNRTHVDIFAGIGGMSLAAEAAGLETVLHVEKEPYCQKVLAHHWPGVPLIEDVNDMDRLEKEAGEKGTQPFLLTAGVPCSVSLQASQEKEREQKALIGSGRRQSKWLEDSNRNGAYLRTLLASSHWGNPLVSLAWKTKLISRDGLCSKSQPLLFGQDTTSQETVTAIRVFRLSVQQRSAPRTGETGCGSSAGGEMSSTASSRDWKDTPGMAQTGTNPDGSERKRDDQLARQAALWATPKVCSATYQYASGDHSKPFLELPGEVKAHDHDKYQTGPAPSSSEEQTGPRGSLNPDFTCWLMGFPAGHLNFEDSETPQSPPCRSRSFGPSSRQKKKNKAGHGRAR